MLPRSCVARALKLLADVGLRASAGLVNALLRAVSFGIGHVPCLRRGIGLAVLVVQRVSVRLLLDLILPERVLQRSLLLLQRQLLVLHAQLLLLDAKLRVLNLSLLRRLL